MLEHNKELLRDWEERFLAKYKRKATLEDIKKYPKVLKIYEEIKNAPKDVILPTPTKKTSKGLFKTLSTSNVLQKRLAECLDPPAKKSKIEEISQSADKGKVNVFGVPVKAELSSAPTPGVTIEDSEVSLKMIVAENKGFGNAAAKSVRTTSVPLNPFAKSDLKSPKPSQFQKVVNDLKNSQNKQDKQKSPVGFPKSTLWRASMPKSTPLKKAVEKAMSVGVKPVEKFVLPNQFVNHRSMKRTSSFNLPLPTNYKEFLTKDEELSFADIIVSQASQDNESKSSPPLLTERMTAEPSRVDSEISRKIDDTESRCAYTDIENVQPVISTKEFELGAKAHQQLSVSAKTSKRTQKTRTLKNSSRSKSDDEFDDLSESQVDFEKEEGQVDDLDNLEKKSVARAETIKSSKKERVPAKPKKAKSLSSKPSEQASSTGWDSKKVAAKAAGNQNYRAFNLKSKKGAAARPKVGKDKFKKTKKLSTYNYERTDGSYLVAGYEENEEEGIDSITENIKELTEFDKSKFVFGEQSGESCKVSESYGVSGNVYVNLKEALKAFTGYEVFRQGQEQVIRRILAYDSTLLILPTGSGKSLCFQLPAFILKHVPREKHSMVMVVSPTISLMMDQLSCLPPAIRGACLSSADEKASNNALIERIKNCEVDVLFVSPERLRSDSFIRLIQKQILPPISFVCVDEVHCISEWSHNFRTSYLHLHSSLLETLNVGCILGLTGTATVSSQESICNMLRIDKSGIISRGFLRKNLKLSVQILNDDENKENALLELIRSEQYDNLKSIIVYVMFQNQADQLAQFLRIRNLDAESYHAGRAPAIRSEIQSRFLRGKLRILTATVAFGMGINKPDIDAVIHYNLPKSIENYVQETGRAGRDGRNALCRLLLAREDYIKHRSFVYSESVDNVELMGFLKMLFSEDGPVVGLTMSDCEKQFDIKEGVISTILSYIELSRPELLQVMPSISSSVILYFVQGVTMEDLCKEFEWFWNIASTSRKSKGGIEFDVISVANASSMLPRNLFAALWDLQAKKRLRFKLDGKITPVLIHKAAANTTDGDFLFQIRDEIYEKLVKMEKIRALKLDETYEMLYHAGLPTSEIANDLDPQSLEMRQAALAEGMAAYFERSELVEMEMSQLKSRWGFRDSLLIEKQKISKLSVEIAIKQFLQKNYADIKSGRTLARIFHGISTPKYLAYEWSRTEFWGKYPFYNFQALASLADKAIANFQT